ncbi:hypothetical protein VTH06DRAFT_2109, partial [Thermothelomyces fergusii]
RRRRRRGPVRGPAGGALRQGAEARRAGGRRAGAQRGRDLQGVPQEDGGRAGAGPGRARFVPV